MESWSASGSPWISEQQPASSTLCRTRCWYSGSTRATRSSIVSATGAMRLSQAVRSSAVMSSSVGLPLTGASTVTRPLGLPTKLFPSFHSRTMWMVKLASG